MSKEFALTEADQETLRAVRRDITARIKESVDDGGEEFAPSLLAEWREQVALLERLAP